MSMATRLARAERAAADAAGFVVAEVEKKQATGGAICRLLDYARALVNAHDAGEELPERYILPGGELAHWTGQAKHYQEHDVWDVRRYFGEHGDPFADPFIQGMLPADMDARQVQVMVALVLEPERAMEREGRPFRWEDWGMEFQGGMWNDPRPRKYHRPAPALPDSVWTLAGA